MNVYVDNLKAEYDTFCYAEPNTMLNPKMLDRYLYDMLPNAWTKLNRTTIPPPLPVKSKKHTLAELERQIDELTIKNDTLLAQNVELSNTLNATKANLQQILHAIG